MNDVVPKFYYNIKSLDELLDRDKQREEDGFPKKIRLGKIAKPGKGNKIVIVPTTIEEKFYHDDRFDDTNEWDDNEQPQDTGTAEGEEGDIIGERSLYDENEGDEGDDSQAGQGSGGDHESDSESYQLGKVLTEKFKLPNLKDKGKKKSITKYVFELNDRNYGDGQVLDKKQTLSKIIKTNIALDRVNCDRPIDTENLIISPKDFVYRVLTKQKDFESQAVVFFVRDYSGSMGGKPTEIVCAQHVMLYSWLMYQYKERVQTRYIVHDTEAKEVPDFNTYYNMNIAGGTSILSAFKMINKIVDEENLIRDNNIYIFYGGDGDDWRENDSEFVKQLQHTLTYVNRLGITIVRRNWGYDSRSHTEFEKFLYQNRFMSKNTMDRLQMDVIRESADDDRIIEGIKKLVQEV